MRKFQFAFTLILLITTSFAPQNDGCSALFNGKDLTGSIKWHIKIP